MVTVHVLLVLCLLQEEGLVTSQLNLNDLDNHSVQENK